MFLTSPAAGASEASEAVSRLVQSTAPLRRIELVFIWGFWGFIALLTFASAMMNDAGSVSPKHLPPMAPLMTALIEGLVWAMLTPLLFKLTRVFSLEHKRWLVSLLFLLALGIVLSLCVTKLMNYVRYEQAVYYTEGGWRWPGVEGLRPIVKIWFMNEFIIYLVIMAAGYAHDYFYRYRKRHEEAIALQTQAAHMRAELAGARLSALEARLSALRTQLNPHFLFNTLNTVSSMVEYDPSGAQRMIARLSDLLRETLVSKELEVPLERELGFIRRYIDIVQTRFQGRLEALETIAPDTLRAMVPSLILQPLVENAIKHGVAKRSGIGRIEIRAERIGEMLHLSVLDNGASHFTSRLRDQHDGIGLGLKNTRARLLQSYGENQSLTLRKNTDGGVVAEVVMPFHMHADAALAQP